MRDMNIAFMMKNCWSLINEPNKLWVRVIKAKYGCTNEIIPVVTKKSSMSNLWQGICAAWDWFRPNIRWKVGNGRKLGFWIDNWLPGLGAIINHALVFIPPIEMSKCVHEYVSDQGEWEIDHICELVPSNVWQSIISSIIPTDSAGADSVLWGPAADGVFSVLSAFEVSSQISTLDRKPIFKVIWRWKGPERTRAFLWRVAHESLMTNSTRVHRGIALEANCPACNHDNEDTWHVLLHCNFAQQVWSNFLAFVRARDFSNSDIQTWLLHHLSRNHSTNEKRSTIFATTIDCLWHRRNRLVFQNTAISSEQLVVEINARVRVMSGNCGSALEGFIPTMSNPSCFGPVHLSTTSS
uniref:Ribonuclease H protein At1g65750 family n=1 Tax=Cajanus cajan TaxID=3821 RepID=A0A151TYV6_CAJCA|nr:Putative ribonuclease H protein At1g65750 family [Cajanus cajan]